MIEKPNTEELRASDYEYALILALLYPEAGGPEYWMVEIQGLRRIVREQVELIQQMVDGFNQMFEDVGEQVHDIIEAFSDFLDAMEAAPLIPLCPKHNAELTAGGYCKQCQKRSY